MKAGATISQCGNYRYALWRIWQGSLPRVMFIGLNPSTADEHYDDATVRRCMGFAERWGFGGLYMTNLFAFRATEPSDLDKVEDPIGGTKTARLVEYYAKKSGLVIAAWGTKGNRDGRDREILRSLHQSGIQAVCLGQNQDGTPKHPLYLPKDAEIQVIQTGE